jgi:hypothetical protein
MAASHAWKDFERTVGAAFSRWLTDGTRKDVVARQSLLGRMVERKYGDLAPHPDCPDRWRSAVSWFFETFQVDAKNRKSFRLARVLATPNHEFWGWWAKLTEQTAVAGAKKRLMVIQHPGAHLLLFGVRERLWLRDQAGRWTFPTFSFRRGKEIDEEVLTICRLENWTRAVSPVSLGCPEPPQKGEPT